MKIRFISICLIFIGIAASSATSANYPTFNTTPRQPYVGDKIELFLIKGHHPKACAPTYYATTYYIEKRKSAEPGPHYTLYLYYQEKQYDTTHCNKKIIAPYGPKYTLQNLQPGKYRVMDGKVMAGHFDVEIPITITGDVTGFSASQNPNIRSLSGVAINLEKLITNEPPHEFKQAATTFSKNDGSYMIRTADRGFYRITYEASGYIKRIVHLNLTKDTALSIEMLSGQRIAVIRGGQVSQKCDEPPCDPISDCKIVIQTSDCSIPLPNGDTITSEQCHSFVTKSYGNGRYNVKRGIRLFMNNQKFLITASKEDYKPKTKTMYLSPGDNITVDFSLEEEYPNKDTMMVDGMLFTIATEKKMYTLNEPINIRYSLTNRSMGDITYKFPTSCQTELTMFDSNAKLLVQKQDTPCNQESSQFTVLRDSTKHFYYTHTLNEPTTEDVRMVCRMIWYPKSNMEVSIKMDQTTPVVKKALPSTISGNYVQYSSRTGSLLLHIGQNQEISFEAFRLNGKKIPQVSWQQFFLTGSHTIPLSNVSASGIVILKINGATFSETKRLNFIGSR